VKGDRRRINRFLAANLRFRVGNRGLVTAADPTRSDLVTGLPDRSPWGVTCRGDHEPMFADLLSNMG
jgi:hypothetical protein